MLTFPSANKFANRGKKSEDAVQKFLEAWCKTPQREYHRLTDTKAAGRIIKAAAADFEFFCARPKTFGLIEVKETEHEYRLARDKVPQLPRLRKRMSCGGECIVLVFHSTLKQWRVMSASWLASNGDKGSWNLTSMPLHDSVEQALQSYTPGVFHG